MPNEEIPFTDARRRLSSILDEVQKPGKTVTIVRRGKPEAVIIGHDEYVEKFQSRKTPKWRLGGSATVSKGVDIDEALQKATESNIRLWTTRMKRWNND